MGSSPTRPTIYRRMVLKSDIILKVMAVAFIGLSLLYVIALSDFSRAISFGQLAILIMILDGVERMNRCNTK